jgi:hypothetical protein
VVLHRLGLAGTGTGQSPTKPVTPFCSLKNVYRLPSVVEISLSRSKRIDCLRSKFKMMHLQMSDSSSIQLVGVVSAYHCVSNIKELSPIVFAQNILGLFES